MSTPTHQTPNGHHAGWTLAIIIALIGAVGAIVAAFVQKSAGDDNTYKAEQPPASTAPATSGSNGGQGRVAGQEPAPTRSTDAPPPASDTQDSAQPTITFDALGGGSNIIDAFASPNDRNSEHSTYRDGQSAQALCRIEGRVVTSDPSVGEEERSSSTWVEIPAPPGLRRFATLTYGDLNVAMDALPECTDVP